MKIVSFVILATLICLTQQGFAQDYRQGDSIPNPEDVERKGFDWSKVYVGGALGAQFGGITFVNVSPAVGYRITDRTIGGVSLTYMYYNDKAYSYETSMFGGSVFGRYFIFDQVFLHSEYEVLNVEAYEPSGDLKRRNAAGFLVGGGYRSSFGGNSFFAITGLWNLLDDPLYPYRNPIIRVGFGVGL